MSGIKMYNLLKIMNKTGEKNLVEQKYAGLGLAIETLNNYTFRFRKSKDMTADKAQEKNNNCFQIIEILKEENEIKQIFDDIWSSEESKNRINAEPITVTEQDIVFFKEKIKRELSELKESRFPLDDFYSILYAVIALKIYYERLCRNLILPEIREINGEICNESDAIEDFKALKQNPKPGLYCPSGRKAADIFNFKYRAECQFADSTPLPVLMQQIQLTGKMITFLNNNGCLNRRFTKESLFGDHVPNDFRPAAVKYIVDEYVKGLPEKNHNLSMFNPTGGWGARLIGALATPRITRYVETDPNPDLLDVKTRIVKTCGSDGKSIFLHQLPIEKLDKDDFCPEGGGFTAHQGHDFSFFSPPYFNVEKYKDQVGNNCQSYKQYPTLENWIRNFLLVLIDINYRALRVSGMMIINVAPINVKRDLIDDVSNLKNMYPGCIVESGTALIVIDIPNIIKLELSRGLRNRLWQHERDLTYTRTEKTNVIMFFKTKSAPTPIYRKYTTNFVCMNSEISPNCKRKLNGAEEKDGTDFKKPRL